MSLVLLVDDESEVVLSLSRALKLKDSDLNFEAASKTDKAIELAKTKDFDVAIIDLNLDPKIGVDSGFALLEELLAQNVGLKIIVLTGNSCIENGVRALRMGAAHFLEKPADLGHLLELTRDCIRQRQIFRAYKDSFSKTENLLLNKMLAGGSKHASELKQQLKFAASTNQPVLFLGETGTGKTLCASLLHSLSPRANKKFISYSAAYCNADLVNSELFGHLKGSFTGANDNRQGLLKEADCGTFFVDEIDEMPHDVQVSLLKVLQNKTFRMLGSNKEEHSDFRFVSASNRAEQELVFGGKIRSDFFHRVAHQIIGIPALRERLEDVAEIANSVLENLNAAESLKVYSISQQAFRKLQGYSWPGNIRELEAVVTGAAYRARFEERAVVQEGDFEFRAVAEGRADMAANFHELVENYKLKLVKQALEQSQNNQVQAAKILGLDRSCLRRIIGRG